MHTRHTELFVTEAGTPLTYSGLKELFRMMQEKSGITRVSIRAHICRHTFATKAHHNGMRGAMLQQLLGHAQFDTTVKYYLHITESDLRAEHQQYGPMDGLKVKRPARKLKEPWEKLPSAQKLLEEVQASTFRDVARKYGVSDTLIHKRLRKAGIHP
jgi:hypothetical protein